MDENENKEFNAMYAVALAAAAALPLLPDCYEKDYLIEKLEEVRAIDNARQARMISWGYKIRVDDIIGNAMRATIRRQEIWSGVPTDQLTHI